MFRLILMCLLLAGCATLGIAQPPPFDEKRQELVLQGLTQFVDLVPGAKYIYKAVRPLTGP